MKKSLLVSLFASLFCGGSLLAQTTGTYIVADNGTYMASCQDTIITMEDIYNQMGIRDLNDANEDASNYRILQLNGSLITSTEITSFKFSDYPAVYIEKKNTTFNGHNGVQIFVNMITPPTELFHKDTLKYTVDKGAKVNIVEDIFNASTMTLWSSNKDVLKLQERILFRDMSTTTELPISQVPTWAQLGPGLYKITYFVSVCDAEDIFTDFIFVKVTESLCHNVQIKGGPSFCREEVADITPFVYVDGNVATAIELADMTFYNKSNSATTGSVLNPTAIDMSGFKGVADFFPKIEIAYQPNVTLGTCGIFQYVIDTKVPTTLASSNVMLTHDNYDIQRVVIVESDYYAFENKFNKNVLQELYLDNYNVYNGTTFHFYTDELYQNEVLTTQIPAGKYYLLALNSACDDDSTKLTINVKESNFKIIFDGEQNQGKGYYTFTAPSYPGATYEWMQWGGSIVAGLGTNQVTVYYSESASQGVFITCKITIPSASAKVTAGESSSLYAAIYLKEDAEGNKVEITEEVTTGLISESNSNFASAYPNPADGTFSLSGDKEFDVKVCNALGQIIYEQKNYTPNTPINISGKGMHVAHLTQNGKTQAIKVVLK